MLRSHSRDLVIRGAGRGRPVGDVGVLSGGEEVRCPAGRGPERAALSHMVVLRDRILWKERLIFLSKK